MLIRFFIFGLFWMTISPCSSQAVLWVGGPGDWNVAANWDCACVPGISDSVTILNGTVTIPAGYPVFSELIVLSSNSVLINHDTLTISNAGAHGLIVEGSFENYGKLIITEALFAGLSIENMGIVSNQGIIEIDSVDATAISLEDNGAFANDGTISIVAYYDKFGIYTGPSTEILNTADGIINVTGGYPFASALSIDGLLINEGLIDLYHGDVDGLGKLINHGDFFLDHPFNAPEQGIQLSHITNEETGHLTVAHTSSWAFVLNDTIINHGLIEISHTATDGLNIGGTYLINEGEIRIDSTNRYGIITGLNTVLRNENGGQIHISNALAAGMRIERIAMYNNGIITMDTVGSNALGTDHGIECVIEGRIYNDTLGQILIDSCYASGLSLATAFSSVNHGWIHVRRARQNGVALSAGHQFLNSGTIDIDTLQGVGLILTTAATAFHNTGEVIIGPTMDLADFSINNSSMFTNDTCGFISTVNKLRNSGTFINQGFLKNHSTTAHTFTAGGTTTNHGVIEDYTGFIFANANMDNNGIIVNARTSTGCPDYVINNALSLGQPDDFVVTEIVADNPSRSSVASYDSLTNQAIQVDIFPVTTDWLWVIQNVHTGCQDSIRMKVSVACPIICNTEDINYWTGCLNTSGWNETGNWTAGIPVPMDTVVIPFLGIRPDPVVSSGTTIHALELRKSAQFTIESGVLFSIQ